MVDSATAKAHLRTTVQRMRGVADATTIAAASARAVDLLAELQGVQRARSVVIHDALPGDLDVRALVDRLAERGARVVVLGSDAAHPVVAAPGRTHLAGERVAEKLGFTREGILREELRINGVWVDHTLYSLLEHEHGLRPAKK